MSYYRPATSDEVGENLAEYSITDYWVKVDLNICGEVLTEGVCIMIPDHPDNQHGYFDEDGNWIAVLTVEIDYTISGELP